MLRSKAFGFLQGMLLAVVSLKAHAITSEDDTQSKLYSTMLFDICVPRVAVTGDIDLPSTYPGFKVGQPITSEKYAKFLQVAPQEPILIIQPDNVTYAGQVQIVSTVSSTACGVLGRNTSDLQSAALKTLDAPAAGWHLIIVKDSVRFDVAHIDSGTDVQIMTRIPSSPTETPVSVVTRTTAKIPASLSDDEVYHWFNNVLDVCAKAGREKRRVKADEVSDYFESANELKNEYLTMYSKEGTISGTLQTSSKYQTCMFVSSSGLGEATQLRKAMAQVLIDRKATKTEKPINNTSPTKMLLPRNASASFREPNIIVSYNETESALIIFNVSAD